MPEFFGWVPNPRWTEYYLATLPRPTLAEAAPDLKLTDEKRDVLFWDFEEKVLGKRLPAHNQTIGDCVSHGWGRGTQDLKLIQIVIGGNEAWQGEIATEPIYAGSRVEIGRGGLGNGDGSLGGWAAEWVRKYGVLLRTAYGGVDLTRYDGARARAWGARGRGVPDELEPLAREHPVQTVTLVTTGPDARGALQNGYPIPVCSLQGFTTVRDASGFCRPQGQWAHCMLARGYCLVKGNRPAVPLQQSWGNSPTGPDRATLESGREITLPQGVFLIDLEVLETRMLRQQDSYTMSNFTGFPGRDLGYYLI